LSKILKYTLIFGIIPIIVLYAISIQNFDTNLTNQVFAVDKLTKELQVQSNSSSLSNSQTYALGSPYIVSKAPSSTEPPGLTGTGGSVLGTGSSGINSSTESKALPSNAETNVINNPKSFNNQNCSLDPRNLIACSINPSNTNCGINPQAPPCCLQPSNDPSCNKSTTIPINPTNPSSDCGRAVCPNSNLQNKNIELSNINTIPTQVHVGNQFTIQATVTNNDIVGTNNNSPIKYVGSVCGGSPLQIEFNKNVKVENKIACMAISFATLNSNEKATVQGSTAVIFTASNAGSTTAKVTFDYTVDDKPDSITKSFAFDILP
jgi:hypothetical protein